MRWGRCSLLQLLVPFKTLHKILVISTTTSLKLLKHLPCVTDEKSSRRGAGFSKGAYDEDSLIH